MRDQFENKRLRQEYRTIEAMLRLYCRDHHHPDTSGLCGVCSELLGYARKRLAHCPFGERKPTCGNCAVHCYRQAMRQRVKAVMRYAGPRMVLRHPLLALRHLLDGRRPAPELRSGKGHGKR